MALISPLINLFPEATQDKKVNGGLFTLKHTFKIGNITVKIMLGHLSAHRPALFVLWDNTEIEIGTIRFTANEFVIAQTSDKFESAPGIMKDVLEFANSRLL